GYGLYVYVLFLMIGSKEGEDTEEGDEEDHSQPLWRTIAGLVVGIAAIGVLCHFMIEVGGDLAESFGISFLLVSALVFAPGTSLPDLLLSTISARKGAGSASISNAFGSNSFDLTVCLAAPVLVVGDIQVQTGGTITWSVWMLLGTVALTMFVVRTGYELTKLEGAILVGTFVVLAVTLVLLTLGVLGEPPADANPHNGHNTPAATTTTPSTPTPGAPTGGTPTTPTGTPKAPAHP
ncbi:MAG: hypothetical protein AAFS10_15325, partial [Myxococcota bacterium]